VRRLAALLAFTLALAVAHAAAAKDMGSLYDDATLEYWQQRYANGIERNFEEIIRPQLTPEERRQLADVQFAFPLRGLGADPFSFYATNPPPTVNLPVMSIKFFDDLSVALAWLWRNGFGLDTVYEYVGMLKYTDLAMFGGRYPEPLSALRIPADALADQTVSDLADKIFDSGVAFVLLHELGHIRYHHPGNGPEVPSDISRANEEAADAFALDVLRRLQNQPTGMAFLFMAFAHGTPNRGDYGSEAEYQQFLRSATHPLSEARLQALADALMDSADDFARNEPDPTVGRKNMLFIADQLTAVAQILGDPDMQRTIDQIGRRTTLAMLAPRRPDQIVAVPTVAATPSGLFSGVYKGSIQLPDGSIDITTVLRSQGDRVSGDYYYGARSGSLTGIIDKGILVFEWREGAELGHGRFIAGQDGQGFHGSWGFGDSDNDGGNWTGQR